MRLEACNSLRLASLTNGVNCVANTHLSLNRLEFFVQCNEHAWVDRKSQIEEEVMVLARNEGLHVSGGEQDGQKTCQRDVREEEFFRVEWVQAK